MADRIEDPAVSRASGPRARLRAGTAILDLRRAEPAGSYTEEGGEPRFRIEGYDSMPPFLMTLVSDSDLWLFISSSGPLTAGRRDPDAALFPYCNDDRLHDSAGQTGSATVARIVRGDAASLWEPFSERYAGVYSTRRALTKSAYGHHLAFEERNADLELLFEYSWCPTSSYGFLRRARLVNEGADEVEVELLDGLLNVMPAGLTRRFQADFSTLAEAYRDSELAFGEMPGATASGSPGRALALYRLSSVPTDRAEPSEALAANTVWSEGLDPDLVLLCADQLDAFRRGDRLRPESRVRGRRGAYLTRSRFVLGPGQEKSWLLVADVGADSVRVRDLLASIAAGSRSGRTLRSEILDDAAASARRLRRIVASVDGLQLTASRERCWRHYSNALFNAMRGGFPPTGYSIVSGDFASFLSKASRDAFARSGDFLAALPVVLPREELVRRAKGSGDADLERLAREYLPLAFSRRHGDPSRPWNSFTIASGDGSRLGYEGNWRDIFQNWEALALSYPGYLDGMIFKFLDATTADGHNPYRITHEGIEWEVVDENDEWSFIGYWGDHQAAYLVRLLEAAERYRPGELRASLRRRLFAYAQVPYRIKDYASLLRDPRSTVEFDAELHGWILERCKSLGADGKLLRDPSGSPYRACLAEKLLVTILAKMANYVPDAGIWMNTQRPEWNDANNALVGYGASVVTLCHLRRLVAFCRGLFAEAHAESTELSVEVARLSRAVAAALDQGMPSGPSPLSPGERKRVMDDLGEAGGRYRAALYERGFSGIREAFPLSELASLCDLILHRLDHSLRTNKGPDGLYHAYNLLRWDSEGVEIRRLPVMLEGQVAALSAGSLGPEEAAELLEALRSSALYRPDQGSYLLYPDRELPSFLEKNNLPADFLAGSKLAGSLVSLGKDSPLLRDRGGGLHFAPSIRNARCLEAALDSLAEGPLADLVRSERGLLLQAYEELFDHHSFTGRSGAFYKYEGLGSIYWHMVSKLLLAVGEIVARAPERAASTARLKAAYRDIREGIGARKSPAAYGAFPTDPYSHTPSFAGAQQPGMTGQVKEDLISRFAELGASVRGGRLRFAPSFAAEDEFLDGAHEFAYVDAAGDERTARIGADSYAFTICQTLVVAHVAGAGQGPGAPAEVAQRSRRGFVEIARADGSVSLVEGLELSEEDSAAIFGRRNEVQRLDVHFPGP